MPPADHYLYLLPLFIYPSKLSDTSTFLSLLSGVSVCWGIVADVFRRHDNSFPSRRSPGLIRLQSATKQIQFSNFTVFSPDFVIENFPPAMSVIRQLHHIWPKSVAVTDDIFINKLYYHWLGRWFQTNLHQNTNNVKQNHNTDQLKYGKVKNLTCIFTQKIYCSADTFHRVKSKCIYFVYSTDIK